VSETHLEPEVTGRGFKHLPPIPGAYGGEIRTYESSAASAPHIWIYIDQKFEHLPPQDAVVHLALEDATRFRDQLTWLIDNHYQVEGSE
jgi:hypothetical protein